MHSVPSDVDSADHKTLEDKLKRETKFFKSAKHVIEDDGLPKNLNTLNNMFKGQQSQSIASLKQPKNDRSKLSQKSRQTANLNVPHHH